MDKQNLLCSHLIEKAKILIKNVVGKDAGSQFKFYLDLCIFYFEMISDEKSKYLYGEL